MKNGKLGALMRVPVTEKRKKRWKNEKKRKKKRKQNNEKRNETKEKEKTERNETKWKVRKPVDYTNEI